MTTEEKLQHFSEVSMETAREEAEKAITEFRSALDADLEQHKKEKQAASKQQLKAEAENAAREINKALSAEHLHIKRKLSRKQQELREQLFLEIKEQLIAFTKSEEYPGWLEDRIKKALKIAGEDEVEISLSLAVIPKKNILIDYTLLTSFLNEKESFNFDGGLTHE